MAQPKVIFLDAVGTLFGVKDSVGDIYSAIAHHFGVIAPAPDLDTAFYHVFKNAPPPRFPGTPVEKIPQKEFQWWYQVTQQTFQKVGAFHQFLDFDAFFKHLYEYFATPHPWEIYPDVFPCLQRWYQQGMTLGIISNFDTRLYDVLKVLEMESFFSSITISSEVGAAKPEPYIFQIAMDKHNVAAEDSWHIGDSRKEDYQGANAVGMQGILLKRSK